MYNAVKSEETYERFINSQNEIHRSSDIFLKGKKSTRRVKACMKRVRVEKTGH